MVRCFAAVVVLCLSVTGCPESSYRLKPTAPMATRVDGVEVEVVALEFLPRNASKDEPDPVDQLRVVLRLTNHTDRVLPFDATRLAVAKLERSGRVARVAPVVPEATQSPTEAIPETHLREAGAEIAADVAVMAAGTRLGVVIIPRPGRELVGYTAEAAEAVVVAAVVLPIAVVLAIDKQIRMPPDHFHPGETARFALDLGGLQISGSEDYVLLLGSSLGLAPGAVAIPLTDPTKEHGGFRPPRERQSLGFRLGGGGAHFSGSNGATAEVQVYTGWKLLGVSIGPMLSVPVLSFGAGLQARWSPRLTERSRIDASLSYEGRNLFHSDLGWTHGPVLGFDLLWFLEKHSVLGWPVGTSQLGMFVRGGPVFRDSDLGALWQAGLSYIY
jgi:hypothetical protein